MGSRWQRNGVEVLNAWIGGVEVSVGKYVDALWDARRFTKSTQKDLRCGVLWRLRPDADSRDCCGRLRQRGIISVRRAYGFALFMQMEARDRPKIIMGEYVGTKKKTRRQAARNGQSTRRVTSQ